MLSIEAAEPRRAETGTIRDWYEVKEKPVGGFARLSVHQALLVAWARATGLIGPFEFRLWWAAVELKTRREAAANDRDARHRKVPSDFGNYSEWAGLIGSGGGEKKARRGLRKLKRLGLLTCTKSSIQLIESPDELRCENLSGYWELVQRVGLAAKRGQPLPVPRTAVRLLAGGVGRGVAATMLGVLLRCVRRRKLNGQWMCVSGGLVSASFIADVFGVGDATVKHAFKHLQGLRWIERLETPQWVQQRHGARTVVNLSWSRPAEEPVANGVVVSTPQIAKNEAISTPPITETKNSLRDKKTRNPVEPGRSGFSIENIGKEKPATIKHVVVEDLRSTPRLLSLFEQAAAAGLVGEGDGQRLAFVAAAEHALVKGTLNPCGLFMSTIRKKRWHYCTNDDEDAAHERLKRYFYGSPRRRDEDTPARPRPVHVPLSDDAKLVAAVQRVAVQHRIGGEPFHLLKVERPEWTRQRWDTAVHELEDARLRRLGLAANSG